MIHFGKLIALDAKGKALPARFDLTGRMLAIQVDTKGAVYPVIIDPLVTSATWTAESDQQNARFGCSVSTAGDVNDDGYSDVIVGARFYDNGQTDEGRVFVYHGSRNGLSTSAAWTAESDQINAHFGWSVGTAGDVNNDGYSDIIVGAPYYKYNGLIESGLAFVYHGASTGLSTTANWTAVYHQLYSWVHFGLSVSTAGDVNGDGYSDVIVGSSSFCAAVYHGAPGGLSTTANWTAESDQADARFGYSVSTAGDVNGDGYSDVVVGAPYFDNGETDEGQAYVYHGSSTGLSTAADWTAESKQAGAFFGSSVSTAGDVNGDGYSDIIVGAYKYDNGQTDEGCALVYHGSSAGPSTTANWTAESDQADANFGNCVSTAGDVNGDGYSDVIVGAPWYDNGQTDEGRAYVYHGASTGLNTIADWTAESDQADRFGYSVSTAGDVNGDGYSDVIVGASGYDNGEADEGRAYVYHGSLAGLSTTADWTAESNQAFSQFGQSVSTAGDVNGDGYSDVIIGAAYSNNHNRGWAFVYQGSSAGLSNTVAWSAESDQAGDRYGRSVSTAGDVNGDGYSDVIVGAPEYNNQLNEAGRAFVFYGTSTGVSTTANWTAKPLRAYAGFGHSVTTAGDVNGDGYSDIIVGAPSYDNGQTIEGRVYIFYGASAGLSSTPGDWIAASDQADAWFGYSVGTAGDVNGDGYSDVIVGAPTYDDGQTNEGQAFVYYGNSSAGISYKPQQVQSNDIDLIAPLGMMDRNRFHLGLLGKTPFGRGKVKLEWEVKPLGTLFDGTGTSMSSAWIDTGTTGAAMSEHVTGLAANSIYHWRMRMVYHPATALFQKFSRWFTPVANGLEEADLRFNDSDLDRLSDVMEDQLGTNSSAADSDHDNVADGDEYDYWGGDWDTDFDGDGIINNLLDDDADGDGHLDGDEINAGYDPSDPASHPGDKPAFGIGSILPLLLDE